MSFINVIKDKARSNIQTIVLPESMDKRVLKAAEIINKEGLAEIVIIGNQEKILKSNPNLRDVSIIDPFTSELTEEFVIKLYELRKHKGLTEEEARSLLTTDFMYFACMLVKTNRADGVVSGACHSSSNTLRPALQIVKTSKDSELVSAFFLMIVPNCEEGENGTFVFADCGLEQNPTPEKLANIAIDSAKSFEGLVGVDAKVAFLSHSTHGSAKHNDVNKVVNALNIAKAKSDKYLMDGELQVDAAIIPEIAASKVPDSPLKGKANVLVFPDLDAGNIGYKLVQRLAKAEAYGPVCQGIAAPINDLSRGCSVEDIVGTVAITAVQAQNK